MHRLFVVLTLGFSLACLSGDAGGTELPYQMSADDKTNIAPHLGPGEEVRVYYDATISLDGSEFAAVTNQRVMYFGNGSVTAIPVGDVTGVSHREEGLIGDIIDVTGTGGQRLRIEIAPLNDGPLFLDVLRQVTGK